MLWHGVGHCRRGGQAPTRVDWHSTHPSASPSTGSPACPGRRVGLGCTWGAPGTPPTPRECPLRAPVDTARSSRAPRGRAARRRTDRRAGSADCGRGRGWSGRARRGGIARQRERARAAFGADADRLWFTGDTLEQAGRPVLADRRVAPAAGGRRGVGGRPGLRGGRLHPRAGPGRRPGGRRRPGPGGPRAHLGSTPSALGLYNRRARWSTPTSWTWWRPPTAGGWPAATPPFLDPARRAGGRRLLDPDRWSPPWSTVLALLDRVPTCVVKVAPGLDHDRVPMAWRPSGCRSAARSWRRCCGVAPPATWRRATVVSRGDGPRADRGGPTPGWRPSPGVRGWLARARPRAVNPVGAGRAGGRRAGRHAGRPDDRLPHGRRALRTPPG